MVTIQTAGLLSLLVLAAALPAQPSDAAAQQLSTSARLSQLLEQAVQRVLSRRPAAGDGAELARLRARLDVLDLRLTTLAAGQCLSPAARQQYQPGTESRPGSQTEPGPVAETVQGQEQVRELQPSQDPETEPQPKPEQKPEPEPPCEERPSPLPADQAPHQKPATLACARSCLQLRDQGGSPQDGVYWFTGMSVPTLCDFSHDGGGWTLLLMAKSRDGWNLLSVRGRRERSPSLDDNYSILRHADAIRDLGSGERFVYRIETQAEKGRQRWGGIWLAPRGYSFIAETPSQTKVICVRKFDKWTYKNDGIRQRMPWLNMHQRDAGSSPVVLTTGDGPVPNGWGSLLYDEGHIAYHHSPWSHRDATQSGKVLYWMREEIM